MSDISGNDSTGSNESGGDNWRKQVQEKADAQIAEAEAKATADVVELKREIAFRDAGLDPTNLQHSYFMRGYNGDDTPEAIRLEAIKVGFVQEVSAGDLQQGEQINVIDNATSGGGTPQSDPEGDLRRGLNEAAELGPEAAIAFIAANGAQMKVGIADQL